MNFWRFLRPSMIGFASKNVFHGLIDQLSGAPTRPLQAARYLAAHARPDDPADVLRTMDRFAAEERWMMNFGPEKGPLIQELAERLPSNARILERIEVQGLIGPGSLVVADNVGDVFDPGDCLDYVRNCGRYASENRAATIEYTTRPDAVEISVFL